jgi:hypothetical protein
MYSRTLLNLALVCLAGMLVLVIVYQPGITPEAAPQTITTLTAENISHIQVTRTTREPLAFTRRADNWFLTGNNELPASDFQIRSVLAILQAESARSYPADSLDLETLGLEPPLATLTLDDTQLKIGATEALDNLRYVQAGETVFLVADRYQHLINSDWPGFVARRLLPTQAKLSQLQLPEFTLSMGTDDQWQLSPANAAVSAAALQTLITNWEQAAAYYVRHYQSKATAGIITLKFSDNTEPLTLHIMAYTPELVLARPELGIQYHLQTDMKETLLALPTD